MLEINEWHERYEVAFRGQEAKPGDELRVGPLRYIRMKVHGYHQGTGQRKLKLLAGDRAMEVYGIFAKLLELAGDNTKANRGKLLNDRGNPATAKDLAFILDVPEVQISYALDILTNEMLRWLRNINSTDTQDKVYSRYTQEPENPQKSPEIPRNPEDPTYFHERDIPPQPMDRPDDDDLFEVVTAWAEKLNRSVAALPSKDQETWAKWLSVTDKQWCLDAIAQAKSPHAGVVAIEHQDRLKATISPMAEQDKVVQAELARRDNIRREELANG